MLLIVLFGAACDSLVTSMDDEGENPNAGLTLMHAEAIENGRKIMASFNMPLDPASVTVSAFKIGSALDNGRGARSTPSAVRFIGGALNHVELTLWDPGLGNGSHSLTATGLRDADGNEAEATSAAFEYRVTIRKPKSFIVRKIVVTAYPSTRENGSTWDFAGQKRPDIYVSFQRPNATPIFVSNQYEDARSSQDYTFDGAASINDPGVPFEAGYNTEYLLSLVDDDFGGNETMVQARFKFSSYYALDNATSDEITVKGDRGFTAVIHGDWTY
jgi:hypothetical protein